MTRDEVLKLALEAGLIPPYLVLFDGQIAGIERFAALVAASERIKHQSEIQRLTELANAAEKWRGIAMARDGDGRTVQQVQAEARADEREMCAQVCDELEERLSASRYTALLNGDASPSNMVFSEPLAARHMAAAIRARGSHA